MDNANELINELLYIETVTQMVLDKSRRLRLKLSKDAGPAKKKKSVFTDAEKASITAARRKNILRSCNK